MLRRNAGRTAVFLSGESTTKAEAFRGALSSESRSARCRTADGENSRYDDCRGRNSALPSFCHQTRLRENLSIFQGFHGANRTIHGNLSRSKMAQFVPLQRAERSRPRRARAVQTGHLVLNAEARQFTQLLK
jgi:hypothetical protein